MFDLYKQIDSITMYMNLDVKLEPFIAWGAL